MKQQQNMYRRSRSSWVSLSSCKILFMCRNSSLTYTEKRVIITIKHFSVLMIWLSRALVGVAGELFFLRFTV